MYVYICIYMCVCVCVCVYVCMYNELNPSSYFTNLHEVEFG